MKFLLWGFGLCAVALIALAMAMRFITHDANTWHVDPTTAARTGKPNDFLIATEGLTNAAPDAPGPAAAISSTELLFLFDAVVRNTSRVEVIGGGIDEGMVTYVQTSQIFGFPDYISVKSIELEDGMSGLVIWSRSRIGYSDMGANRTRVTSWISQLGLPN